MQGYGAGARILEELKPEPPELVIEWSRSHNKESLLELEQVQIHQKFYISQL